MNTVKTMAVLVRFVAIFQCVATMTIHAIATSKQGHITSIPQHTSSLPLPPHKQPLLEYVSTIAFDSSGNMRDPSPVIQDPVTGRWHFCESMHISTCMHAWVCMLSYGSAMGLTTPLSIT